MSLTGDGDRAGPLISFAVSLDAIFDLPFAGARRAVHDFDPGRARRCAPGAGGLRFHLHRLSVPLPVNRAAGRAELIGAGDGWGRRRRRRRLGRRSGNGLRSRSGLGRRNRRRGWTRSRARARLGRRGGTGGLRDRQPDPRNRYLRRPRLSRIRVRHERDVPASLAASRRHVNPRCRRLHRPRAARQRFDACDERSSACRRLKDIARPFESARRRFLRNGKPLPIHHYRSGAHGCVRVCRARNRQRRLALPLGRRNLQPGGVTSRGPQTFALGLHRNLKATAARRHGWRVRECCLAAHRVRPRVRSGNLADAGRTARCADRDDDDESG